jgi:SAM-dependent methyltransferase
MLSEGSVGNRRAAMSYDGLVDGDPVYPGFFTREFMNFGYWAAGATSRTTASEHLMDRLLAAVPEHSGAVLDVACGLGYTTKYLRTRWGPGQVCGINLSERQSARSRETAPNARFAVMDAPTLAFLDERFDAVICVEAAFHFDTRERFLDECLRVLKPGGRLVMTDLLLHEDGHDLLPNWPRVNFVPSPAAYLRVIEHAGFTESAVQDVTESGLRSYLRYMMSKVEADRRSGMCDDAAHELSLQLIEVLAVAHRYNVVCMAVK